MLHLVFAALSIVALLLAWGVWEVRALRGEVRAMHKAVDKLQKAFEGPARAERQVLALLVGTMRASVRICETLGLIAQASEVRAERG